MQRRWWVAMAGGVAVAAFFAFAPEDRVNAAQESLRWVTSRPSQGCLDWVRERLNDPESARLVAWEHGILTYKAKNRYGAYVTATQKCNPAHWRLFGDELARLQARANWAVEDGRARQTSP